MAKLGYKTGGHVIDGGDTSGDIQSAPIVHVGQHNIYSIQAYAPALGGRSGNVRVRASLVDETQLAQTLWPIVATIAVGAGELSSGSNTPLTGHEYVWVEYARTGGGQANDLDVWVSKKRIE